jgi:Tfp pilus assembly protein PilV
MPKRVRHSIIAGFILWEVMLALTIFSIVAVALTSALHQTIDASIVVRDEAQVRLELQNIVAETSAARVKTGKSETKSGDGRITYEREIKAVSGKNGKGEVLTNLYEIVVRAHWRESGHDRADQTDVVIFQP